MDPFELAVAVACSLNQYVPPSKFASSNGKHPGPGAEAGDRPGDDFNRRAEWKDILGPHGWTAMGSSGEKVYWRRPGKDGLGWSATTGYCSTDQRGDLLYVFSSNAYPFEAEQAYSKFEALTLLEYGGDFGAAAKALLAAGWGNPTGPAGKIVLRMRQPDRHPSADELTEEEARQDATAADLIRISATIRWSWPQWLQVGVMNILASEPGIGKTRLCGDLARRIYHGLCWPDGTPATFPAGSTTLWVAADNQHPELGSLPSMFGFPPEALFLNTTRANPFGGTMLDEPEDLDLFEKRIQRIMPALVIIDTTLHATERSSHKPEDAKAFFSPLLQIAARQGACLLGVTHLNAAGKPLGRRVQGHARVVMQLEHPDPEGQPNRRKLYVVKSNSLFPAPLGITMGDHGNEYDATPPVAPAKPEPGSGSSSRLVEAMDWLREALANGPQPVRDIRSNAEQAGIDAKNLYRARDGMGIREYKVQGYKYWALTTEDHDRDSQ